MQDILGNEATGNKHNENWMDSTEIIISSSKKQNKTGFPKDCVANKSMSFDVSLLCWNTVRSTVDYLMLQVLLKRIKQISLNWNPAEDVYFISIILHVKEKYDKIFLLEDDVYFIQIASKSLTTAVYFITN